MPSQLWSLTLVSARIRRPRWLGENGRITSDPAKALRLVSPEVAARRLQQFLQIHGWELETMERFQLVSAPPLPPGSRPTGSQPPGTPRPAREARPAPAPAPRAA